MILQIKTLGFHFWKYRIFFVARYLQNPMLAIVCGMLQRILSGFLISPKAKVATTEMFNALRDGEYGLAAVYGLMIICVTLFVNLFAAFIQKRLRDKKEKAA